MAKTFFYLIPTFTLSMCLGGIMKVAATHLEASLLSWIKGRVYTWTDFSAEIRSGVGNGIFYTIPAP